MSAETLTIDMLGAQGDGIGRTERGPVFVPFALPGETASIALNGKSGTLLAIKTEAAERVTPVCRHFGPDGEGGACGGCALQHFETAAYSAWKRGLVVSALERQGIDAPVDPLVACLPAERRRVTLTARRTEGGMLLGFSEAGSHRIVSITECPIAAPAIADRLDMLRDIAGALASGSKGFRMTVLVTASGLDIAASGLPRLKDRQRRMAVETALSMKGIARITVDGEIVVEPAKPLLHFGRLALTPPPGAFVQASARAETKMATLVADHLAGARKTVDLFAGCGTFAARLAEKSAVHAVESDRAALMALENAVRVVQGLKPVTTERRDLFRSPLQPFDLKGYDGLVFDPPRAGAEAQSHEIARSKVGRVAAVSCNPVTLARDLSILIAGGFRPLRVIPIDQFLWSPHVEAVALLER